MRTHPRFLTTTALLMGLAAVLALTPTRAEAFCGFYVSGSAGSLTNNATQVVLMREGTRTVLSMRNTYKGPPEDFALVVPVPVVLDEDEVKTIKDRVFDEVDTIASPRLVEYWERDPCAVNEPVDVSGEVLNAPTAMESGSWFGDDEEDETTVVVEAQFNVGEYEIVILSADESTGLERWLRQNGYNIPASAAPALRPYIEQGMYFFVARVDIDKVKFDPETKQAELSPLRFHYDSDTFGLPVRLGLLNAEGHQDLIVHILARQQRYQVVNRKNEPIPTNIEVKKEAKDRFAEFYAALFDRVQAKDPGAVVTEYSWDSSLKCDPCTGPVLTPDTYHTLGADVLPGKPIGGFTLTRLHTRYTSSTFKDDLIFAAAPPISGGNAWPDQDGNLSQGAQPSNGNAFQGRYILRHLWEGPIECADPRRGIWGGKGGSYSGPQVSAAQKTAFAARGNIALGDMVAQPVEAIDESVSSLQSVEDTEPRDAPPLPEMFRGPSSCGACAVAATQERWWGAGAALALLAMLVRIRRRR